MFKQPMYPAGQILKYSLCSGRFGARRAPIGSQVIEHLVEDQKGGACRDYDKEQSENENDRTIATGIRPLRTMRREFAIQNLHELFWRWRWGLDFFHGSQFVLMFGANSQERAYFTPFLTFLGLLAVGSGVAHLFDGYAFWMASAPQYWIFPLQTAVCAVLLARGWRWYPLEIPKPFATSAGIGVGILVFLLWVAPQQWLGQPARLEGFDPAFFGSSGWPYLLNVAVRFVRLVVVVPLVEEIFWRGFLLRFLIREDFTKVPIGAFTWLSFSVVTVGFILEHSGPISLTAAISGDLYKLGDWPAAAITGVLYNLVAYRTRSLTACVLAHAVTNGLLGIYVLRTGQLGFW